MSGALFYSVYCTVRSSHACTTQQLTEYQIWGIYLKLFLNYYEKPFRHLIGTPCRQKILGTQSLASSTILSTGFRTWAEVYEYDIRVPTKISRISRKRIQWWRGRFINKGRVQGSRMGSAKSWYTWSLSRMKSKNLLTLTQGSVMS